MKTLHREFTARAVHHLREEYLPRIETASAAMSEEDLWWRPHRDANSVGNLLLHLRGNVSQWILAGLGGRDFARDRDAEFAASGGASRSSLLDDLRGAVLEACAVIERLGAEELVAERRIQGFSTTVMGAVLHVVEHFSWHSGQIVSMAKMRAGAGHGIAFYDDRSLQDPPS